MVHTPVPRRLGSGRAPLLCLLASCALLALVPSAGAEPVTPRGVKPVQTFLEFRQKNVVLQNYDISCGAAALATILAYQHGDPVPEETIAKAMLEHTSVETVRARLGFSLLDLKRYVERRGYLGDGYGELSLEDLVALGPSIVPVRLQIWDHFVVFRGIQGDRVLLADPAFGNRTMSIQAFRKVWQKRIAFVVVRADGKPPPDNLSAGARDLVVPSRAMIRAALG